MVNVIKHLIFSGGGLKCWGYIGTLHALKEYIPFDNINQL